jgi:hypothetical protein
VSAESVTTAPNDARDSLPHVVLESAVVANVETTSRVVSPNLGKVVLGVYFGLSLTFRVLKSVSSFTHLMMLGLFGMFF